MCLVLGLSVSDDDNDDNRQCTMYSSVCFKSSLCPVRHLEMHETHCMREEQETDPVSYAIGECRPPGWYRGKCRSSFVPAVCGSSCDDVMCSSFYSRIHRGRLGLAQRYRGDLVSATISLRSSKALNSDTDVSESDKNPEIERYLGKKRKNDAAYANRRHLIALLSKVAWWCLEFLDQRCTW